MYVYIYIYISAALLSAGASVSVACEAASDARPLHCAAMGGIYLFIYPSIGLKVLCSYKVTALSKFALLRYLSEIRFQVLAAIYPRFTHESGTIRKKQAIDESKLKRLLCHESQNQSQSNEKSLVQFDYDKAVSNYLGTQSTVKLESWKENDKATATGGGGRKRGGGRGGGG